MKIFSFVATHYSHTNTGDKSLKFLTTDQYKTVSGLLEQTTVLSQILHAQFHTNCSHNTYLVTGHNGLSSGVTFLSCCSPDGRLKRICLPGRTSSSETNKRLPLLLEPHHIYYNSANNLKDETVTTSTLLHLEIYTIYDLHM